MLLEGKVCLVVGVSSLRGIGYATAELFADHGAEVITANISLDHASTARVSASIERAVGHPVTIEAHRCDITQLADCRAVIEEIDGRHGKLDCLVNAVGVVASPACSIRARFPEKIYCLITGYGTDEPYSGDPTYDSVIQAASGVTGLMAARGGLLWVVFAWLAISLFAMGFAYGPLGGWLPSLFEPAVRYTGVSVTFNLGGILGGALAPIVAQALAVRGGLGFVGLYLVAAGILSLGGLMLLRRRD